MTMRLALTRPQTGDLVAGLTVALVLIPQSIAYASLAGLSPQQGLYAAAVAPLLASLAGSSPYLQTGPVALTSLLTLGALAPLGLDDPAAYAAAAALLAVIVGATRLIVGLTRLGFVSYLMSQPVVAAFTLGASLLIACSQLPALLGVSATSANPVLAALQALAQPRGWSLIAIAIGVGVLGVTVAAKRAHPLLPGAFLSSIAALVVVAWWNLDVAVVGAIPNGLPGLTLDLPWGDAPRLLVSGVVIAMVGFAEPASIARQYASADRTEWNPDREFVGQGLANLGAGFFGGYPTGGSFSRSALNRLSGARTRWSGAVTGAAVLAVLPVVSVLSDLPKAALAGLIIASVLPLLNPHAVTRTWGWSRPQFVVALATFLITVLAAPEVQWGVIMGVALALAVHLWRELRLDVEVWSGPAADRRVLHVRPQGVLYFGSAPRLETMILKRLAESPELTAVELHLQRLGRVDLTGALVLRAICRDLARGGVPVHLSGAQPQTRRLVEAVFAEDPIRYTRAASATGDQWDREGSDESSPPRPPDPEP